MGCGCGGKGNSARRTVVPNSVNFTGKKVQVQSNQRQLIALQTKERIQAASNNVGAAENIEKRKKIQIAIRNKNQKKGLM